jgi:FAD/FMN-containing dehydrogenase
VGDADNGTAGGWLSMTDRIPDPLLGTPSPPALGLAVVFPDGASWRSIDVPRSACGPELNALFYGTAGAFGVVTEATLRLVPPGAERQCAVWHLLQPASAAEMLRQMALGSLPPVEAQAILWVDGRGTRLQAVFEGAKGLVREALRDGQERARAAGARELRDAGDERIDPPAELPAAAVRWSQLDEVLSKLYLPAVDALVLDRPEIAGCRLRLIGGDPVDLRMRLRRALDEDGERARRRLAQFERLRRLKREWDPGALLNPHALAWLEREATA